MADNPTKSGKKPLFLSREEHSRFRTLTSLLELTEGITNDDLTRDVEYLQNKEPRNWRLRKQHREWHYINCFASILVRDNENIAIVPTSSPGREGLLIAFNSSRQQELAPKIKDTDTANELGFLAVYEWFFENGGDHMSLTDHIHRTSSLLKEWHRHDDPLRYNIFWRHSLLASRVKMVKRFSAGMGRKEGKTRTGTNYFSYLAADAALIPDTLFQNVRPEVFQEEPFCQPPSAKQLALMDKYLSEYDRCCWENAPVYGNAQSRKTFQTLLSAVVRQAWEEMSTFMKLVSGLHKEYNKHVSMRTEGFEKQCRKVDELASSLKDTFRDLVLLRSEFIYILRAHLEWMQQAFQPDGLECSTPNELQEDVQSIIAPIEGLDMTATNDERHEREVFEASEGWNYAAGKYLFNLSVDYWSIQVMAPRRKLSGRIAITDITTVAVVPTMGEDAMSPIADVLEDTRILEETQRHLFNRWFLSQKHISDVHKNQMNAKWEENGLKSRESGGKVQEKTARTTNDDGDPSPPQTTRKKRKDSHEDIRVTTPHEKDKYTTKKQPASIPTNDDKQTCQSRTIPTTITTTPGIPHAPDPATILLAIALLIQNHPTLPINKAFKALKLTTLKYISTTTDLTPTAAKLITLVKKKQLLMSSPRRSRPFCLVHPTTVKSWAAMSLPAFVLREEGEEIVRDLGVEVRGRIAWICELEGNREGARWGGNDINMYEKMVMMVKRLFKWLFGSY